MARIVGLTDFGGDFLVIFMSTIFGRILHIVVPAVIAPLKLVKGAFYKAFRVIRQRVAEVKKKLTGNIKEVKIVLCKHRKRKKRDTHETENAS